jgi:hypothetical protein
VFIPLLTERVVRTFGGSDFRCADLVGAEPLSVYLRWANAICADSKPLLKLVWETLLNQLSDREEQGISRTLAA